MPATSATPVSDPSVSDPQRTAEEKERERAESLRLEEDLDAAVRNASVGDSSASADEGELASNMYRIMSYMSPTMRKGTKMIIML